MAHEQASIRALVVEDSAIQAEFLRRDLLARGVVARLAGDGRAGLEAARAEVPDIVISDISMPVMDGYELCAALKADAATRDVPVVLLTALVDADDVVLGLQAGADAYLTKPYDADRLVATLHRLLAQPRDPEPATSEAPIDLDMGGRAHRIGAGRRQILNLLLSTYGCAVEQNRELLRLEASLRELNADLEGRVRQRTQALAAEQERSHEAEVRYRTLFDELPDAALLVDPTSGALLESNEAARLGLGFGRDDAAALALDAFDAGDPPGALAAGLRRATVTGSAAFPCLMRPRSAEPRSFEVTMRMMRLGGRSLAHCVLRDVTEIRRLRFLASHDPLTGLPNRTLLVERLEQAVFAAARSDRRIAVLALGIDRFGLVNESFGHDAGDAMLREVARRLSVLEPSVHTVARVGGDRFVAVVDGLRMREDALVHARRLQDALADPFEWEGTAMPTVCCIGVALYPDDGRMAAVLVRNAEFAMAEAAQRGAGCLAHFSEQLDREAQQRIRQESELRRALRNDEFVPYFQPLVELATGRVVAAECLLRWVHPERGVLTPGQFMARVEEMGLVVPLTERVLARVAALQRERVDAGAPWVPVSVNLSALHFRQGNVTAMLADVIARTGVDPSMLEIELTESALMSDPARARETLHEIRALGIRMILLDDFGTGYSSLAYLKDFPVDVLKIDLSFVQRSLGDLKSAAITTSTIAMAHRLDLMVIGEGVENAAQYNFLRRNRCDVGQGHLFAPALPAVEMLHLLEAGGGRLPLPAIPDHGQPSVLLVDGVGEAFEPLAAVIEGLELPDGFRVRRAHGVEDAISLLTDHNVVAVICHDVRQDGPATEVLRRAQCLFPDVLRVLASEDGAASAYERASARGVFDLGFRLPADGARLAGVLGDALTRVAWHVH